MINHFSCDADIFFGQNSSLKLFEHVKERSCKNIGIVVDNGVFENHHVQKIIRSFENDNYFKIELFRSRSDKEPDYDYLDDVSNTFKNVDIDCIVGIGGGSACDLTKGVGILQKNPGKGIDYRGFNKVENPGVPVILVPTTAGTGTEATKTAVFSDTSEVKKLGINGKNVGALFAVLDPMVLLDAPNTVKVGAGLDALLHAIEAFSCKNSTVMTKMLGKNAFDLLFNNLYNAINDKNDISAHEKLFLGSHFAGLAMYNAGGGPASGISYPLGAHFKVPHGIAGGIFLPHVFRFNVENGYMDYGELYNCIEGHAIESDEKNRAIKFVDAFEEFYDMIGAPHSLRSYGVKKSDIDLLVKLTMEQRMENLELNPVDFNETDVRNLLEIVIE